MTVCEWCETEVPGSLPPLGQRPVPRESGEAAIYSPEYLERKEGNREGVDPSLWRKFYVPDGPGVI